MASKKKKNNTTERRKISYQSREGGDITFSKPLEGDKRKRKRGLRLSAPYRADGLKGNASRFVPAGGGGGGMAALRNCHTKKTRALADHKGIMYREDGRPQSPSAIRMAKTDPSGMSLESFCKEGKRSVLTKRGEKKRRNRDHGAL